VASRIVLLLALLVLGSCANDLTGIHAAGKTGTLLDPSAPRQHPLTAIRDACGEPGLAGGGLTRLPYVQSVRAHDAYLGWTSIDPGTEAVRLWFPGATSTRDVAPSVATTHYLTGARQLEARLDGLEPRAIVCYELRNEAGDRVFGPTGFRTAPEVGDASERVDIAIFGDSGNGSSDQQAVIDQLGTVPIDFVLHAGDLAYPSGRLTELEAFYFHMYEPLLPSIPFFTAIGDHDEETDHAGPYREVFRLPDNAGPAANERWYSFDWGQVHVIVLDALSGDPGQMTFVEQDLSSSTQPWRIAVAPVPPYSSGFHGSYGSFRALFEPIFQRHGVQLVVSGDDHHYERSRPIEGVTYIVTGGGGRSVREVGTSWWTELSVTVFHFLYVSVEGDTMRVHAIDATGREFDGVEITR
jgi:acid phosphatase type 7